MTRRAGRRRRTREFGSSRVRSRPISSWPRLVSCGCSGTGQAASGVPGRGSCDRHSHPSLMLGTWSEHSTSCEITPATRNAPMATIGFIGLGNMGRPMASNLVRKGFPLVVHDVNRRAGRALAALGARRDERRRRRVGVRHRLHHAPRLGDRRAVIAGRRRRARARGAPASRSST